MNRLAWALLAAAALLIPLAWVVGGFSGVSAAGCALALGSLFLHIYLAGEHA